MIANVGEQKRMKVRVSVSIDSDILEELQELAKRRGISLSALFQRMAILYLHEERRERERERDWGREGGSEDKREGD